jgi:hypothetical protein
MKLLSHFRQFPINRRQKGIEPIHEEVSHE